MVIPYISKLLKPQTYLVSCTLRLITCSVLSGGKCGIYSWK